MAGGRLVVEGQTYGDVTGGGRAPPPAPPPPPPTWFRVMTRTKRDGCGGSSGCRRRLAATADGTPSPRGRAGRGGWRATRVGMCASAADAATEAAAAVADRPAPLVSQQLSLSAASTLHATLAWCWGVTTAPRHPLRAAFFAERRGGGYRTGPFPPWRRDAEVVARHSPAPFFRILSPLFFPFLRMRWPWPTGIVVIVATGETPRSSLHGLASWRLPATPLPLPPHPSTLFPAHVTAPPIPIHRFARPVFGAQRCSPPRRAGGLPRATQ